MDAQLRKQLVTLKDEANQLSKELVGLRRRSLIVSKQLGELLIRIKKIVGHKKWEPWVTRDFDGDIRTAQRYIRIAREWDREDFVAERSRNPDMDFTEANQFLTKPCNPKPQINNNAMEIISVLKSLYMSATKRDECEQSSCFIFKEGHVLTYNDQTYSEAPSPFGDRVQGAINARKLLDRLRRHRDADITDAAVDGRLGRRSNPRLLVFSQALCRLSYRPSFRISCPQPPRLGATKKARCLVTPGLCLP